ncbi:MAG TPA: 2-aminoethylphosphonate--pyruvate transaminase [Geminicoccaceae bacterium]|nr:2-aminoethylphosphonate--pyruvate transaminase [Geminicoccus sp.]HMU50956.1 2-aminoethylphosphonate--pyruvate transaminase [Geminicoccaceae bacterium]
MTKDAPSEPLLLTPGPLTTARSVREAMLRDWGSRDEAFIALNAAVLDRLVALANGQGSHVAVPLQGSGTFVVEAMLGTLLPRDGKALVLVNGAYGERIVRMAGYHGRQVTTIVDPEDRPSDTARLDAALAADPAITHVVAVHCETTSGILNPIERIAEITARYGRRLLIDAMSAFGALPLDARETPFDAVAASSNKCLEGVPGMGFAIVRESALMETAGNAPALSLDLHDQHVAMRRTRQWRFTPPTHVLAAFHEALRRHEAEGGIEGRGGRYRDNCRILVEGMRRLGFETLLPDALQAPIIVTFKMPRDPRFAFESFYDRLRRRGYVIYPGKLTVAPSFRIGCIGHLAAPEMEGAVAAVAAVLEEMGVGETRAA